MLRRETDNPAKEKLYEKLKRTVFHTTGSSEDELVYELYVKAESTTESENKIREIVYKISKNACKKTEFYAILGLELANLKFLNIHNKCCSCVEEADIYVALDCRKYNSKKNSTKAYYATVLRETQFGKAYVNFLIAFGKLCQLFPNFLNVTMTTDDINNKIGMLYLRQRMEQDAEFWMKV